MIKKPEIKDYWNPTPKKWRKLGDSLLAVATLIAVGGLWQFDNLRDIFSQSELKVLIITSLISGVVGKFLTNFFNDDM
jgi:hypothetical protein